MLLFQKGNKIQFIFPAFHYKYIETNDTRESCKGYASKAFFFFSYHLFYKGYTLQEIILEICQFLKHL